MHIYIYMCVCVCVRVFNDWCIASLSLCIPCWRWLLPLYEFKPFPVIRLKFFQAVLKFRPCRGGSKNLILEVRHARWKANLEPFRGIFALPGFSGWYHSTTWPDGRPKKSPFQQPAWHHLHRAEAGRARTKHDAAARPELWLWGLRQPSKIIWWVKQLSYVIINSNWHGGDMTLKILEILVGWLLSRVDQHGNQK